jgi:hypothetical protein
VRGDSLRIGVPGEGRPHGCAHRSDAQSDEIVASAATLAGVESGLPLSERRTVKLKGMAAPVELAAIIWT